MEQAYALSTATETPYLMSTPNSKVMDTLPLEGCKDALLEWCA